MCDLVAGRETLQSYGSSRIFQVVLFAVRARRRRKVRIDCSDSNFMLLKILHGKSDRSNTRTTDSHKHNNTQKVIMASRVHHFKLVLLGDTAVGKSCLVVRFVRDEFFEFQEPTIGGG